MNRFIGLDLHKKSFTDSFYNTDSDEGDLRSNKPDDIDTFKRKSFKEFVLVFR